MKCPRCQNIDPKYFSNLNGRYYCRKCIQFGRVYVDEEIDYPPVNKIDHEIDYHLKFKLVPSQQAVSNSLVERYLEGKDSMILAVCGGGKTEILYELIKTVLNRKESILILIPRKALVVELGTRIAKTFNIKPEMLYGGHIGDLSSPFIISTIHQSYRLSPRDVVIVDEVDAFPLRGNELLENMILRVAKRQIVRMSATIEQEEDLLFLKRRYHNVDLDVPEVKLGNNLLLFIYLLYYIYLLKKDHPILVFVPTFEILNHFIYLPALKSERVSSLSSNIDELLSKLKKRELDVLFTTIVLERGITVDDVQVIVYHSEHIVFNKSTLIQIAGRVGRSKEHPSGKVVFLSTKYTQCIKDCIQAIQSFNA